MTYVFQRPPSTPTFPYESCRDALRAWCSSLSGRFNAWRFAYRCAADDLRRPSGDPEAELIEESEARRSAVSLGPAGMSGTGLSPKTLWLWEEYFCWKGEGIVEVCEKTVVLCVDL
jgi:hypothetical protein